jgi:asparagine synthase (glutamine-hydrolysing)
LSAFAVIYDRSNTPGEPGVFIRVMDRLSHRGPDGSDIVSTGNVTMGHWHFWTTPEEVGERQPLGMNGLPFKIVLDGRIDNREDLFKKLNIPSAEGKFLSDAALILHAYVHWGVRCFENLVGEFALVIFDEECNELICARDHLGDRTLFYAVYGKKIMIASEPWALAGADNSAIELNEIAVMHYFALKATQVGQTMFKKVFELLPAHTMFVNASGQHTWRYWRPDPSVRLRGLSDKEYAEQFLLLLDESVRCRLRSTTRVGVLMSGGLDSGSVACLAARMLAPEQLTTISYVFDELTDCDERDYIETVKTRWGIRSIQIQCDDAWPCKDWINWPRNPNHPEGNAYRLLKERAYRRAHDEGLRVLMHGAFGDELYCGEEDWLADLIVDKQFHKAVHELKRHLSYAGLRKTFKSAYFRRIGRRLLNSIPGGRHLRRTWKAPSWLTADSAAHLDGEEDWLDPAFELKTDLLGIGASQDSSYENVNASRHALELRHPYRDRRLVEYVLSLPAYQLYNLGFYKYILRVAMQGILPQSILSRSQPTSLSPLFSLGQEREQKLLMACFQDSSAAWRKYVRGDWILKHWNKKVTSQTDGPHAVVPWLCISYESWFRSFYRYNN